MKSVAVFILLVALATARVPKRDVTNTYEYLSHWIEPVIVGGDDAEHGEFPHMLQIQYNGNHRCGASIINEEWALTAAHCVIDVSPSNLKLVAGQLKTSEDDGTEQVRDVESFILHPDYNDAEFDYDVAVMKVKSKFEFNDHVQPIALYPDANGEKDIPARTSGWGRLSAGGPIPDHLQKLNVTIYQDKVCRDAYGGTFTENMICAGNIDGGHCVCNGDSGSPLFIDDGDKRVQIGVVSWGNPCANAGYPAAYAEVGAFIDFINESIQK